MKKKHWPQPIQHAFTTTSIALLLLACTGPVAPAQNLTASEQPIHEIAGAQIFVEDADGCTVMALTDADLMPMPSTLPWPCNIYSDTNGIPVLLETPKGKVALIESSRPVTGTKDCDTRIAAIRVQNGRVTLSDFTDRVAACPPFRWDDKLYTGLFDD